MSQFTKSSELHRAWANWLEMCEGTEVNVNSGWKCGGGDAAFHSPSFQGKFSDYEIAIGIVENKSVFIGDELYNMFGNKIIASAEGFTWYNKETFNSWLKSISWNPPKPKTAMVELLVEDIKKLATCDGFYKFENRLYEACRKTLEELK